MMEGQHMTTDSRAWPELLALGTPRRFERRAEIFAEGDEASAAWFIEAGRVERYVLDAQSGTSARSWVAAGGQLVGLEEILSRRPRATHARAVSMVDAVELPAEVVAEALTRSPELAHFLLLDLSRASLQALAWGRTMSFASVEARLADIIDELRQGERVRRLPTVASLAEIVGTSTRSVERVLRRWSDAGWVRRQGRDLALLATNELRERAASFAIRSAAALPARSCVQ
jgi:CRP/FNR family transcriptional regulator, cyclic AMP receptor protein